MRLILDDVPQQRRAVEELIASERCLVPDAALVEMVFVLERVKRLSREWIAETLAVLSGIGGLEYDRPAWREVMEAYRSRPKLSITDVVVALGAARENRTPLATFDEKLAAQMEGTLLLKPMRAPK